MTRNGGWETGLKTLAPFIVPIVSKLSISRTPSFKAALTGTSAINVNGDEEIQIFEAERYDDTIEIAGRNIDSLTGMEAFISIESLDCSGNGLTAWM